MTCRGCGPSPDPEQDREHDDWCPDNPRRDRAAILAMLAAMFGTDHGDHIRSVCRAAIAKSRGQSTSTDTARATE